MNNPVIRARWSEPGPAGGCCLSCGAVVPETHRAHCQFPEANEPAAPGGLELDAGLHRLVHMNRAWEPPCVSWRRGYSGADPGADPGAYSGADSDVYSGADAAPGDAEVPKSPAQPPQLLGSWSSGSPVATRRSSFGEEGSGSGRMGLFTQGGNHPPPGYAGQHPQQMQPQPQWPGRQLPFSQPPPLRGDWSNRALQQQQQHQRQQHQHQTLGHLNGGHNGHGHRRDDDDDDDAGGGAGLVRAMGAPKFVAPIPRPFNAPAAPSGEEEEEGQQKECPLCIDVMDDTDLQHRPCPNCDYNFCLLCFSQLKAGPVEQYKCPGCRHPFGDASGSNVSDSGADSDGDSDASESEIGGAFARAAAAAGRG